MMHSIGTIREFKTRNFTVRVDAVEEDDLDLSWDEDGSTRKGLQSGKFMAFVARVRVYFKGNEVASDYLGGCIYESLEAFMDHRECGKQNRQREKQGKEGRCGSYFADMIATACAEARKTIAQYKTVYVRTVA
jgi:hypothetical protein